MIEETMGGAAASSASHCAAKSCTGASPASGGTSGPQSARKARSFASCCVSRTGGGSGIQRLSCAAPLLDARNSAIQAAMAAGDSISAPHAPRPPAFATAAESEGGQDPAIGASRIGRRRPKREQKACTRSRYPVIAYLLGQKPIARRLIFDGDRRRGGSGSG